MDDLVNTLEAIQNRVLESGVRIWLANESLFVGADKKTRSWPLVRLYRPSATEVREHASSEGVLVLLQASAKAIEAAAPFNHIVLPDGGFRLMAPGVALLRETATTTQSKTTRVRLQGRSGVVAETLLLGGAHAWPVRELARGAGVSQGLAHRVLDRLEKEGCLETRGSGPDKVRALMKPTQLAQMWSQEEAAPKVALRGYLYGASPDDIARKLIHVCPEGVIGGVMAANNYAPTLTRVPFPVRLWVPEGFWLGRFLEAGVEEIAEGVNLEIVQAKGDPWRHHRDISALPQLSPWRAWLEVSAASGRVGELAETLLKRLGTEFDQGN